MSHADPLLQLDGITKHYGKLRALEGISLSIGHGVTGLLGPNGAGKTTLIKVLLGLVHTTRGSGTLFGFQLGREVKRIRARVGYMPEDDCYIAGLSGVETVQYAARLSGLPKIEALRRAHEILDFCGMEQERYRNVETYSTGMRQKLKFAQAIVHDPPLLILDEPTSGLDPEERDGMLNRVRVLADRADKAVIISTHILPDVQMICDSVVILARGRVQVADTLEVLSRPTSPAIQVRVFGDTHRLAERLRQEGLHVQNGQGDVLTVSQPDGAAVQRLWAWAREAGVGIRSLTSARNSLEQVFLDAVREKHRADT